MATKPKDADLAYSLRLARALNEARGSLPRLAQLEQLDQAAWQAVLEMQRSSFQPEEGYKRLLLPAQRVRKLGLRFTRPPVETLLYQRRGLPSNSDDSARAVVEDRLSVPEFRAALQDRRYVWCGAAGLRNCFALVLAG
ncbi:hypothetical protein DMC61_14665 [Amycolatopsis sp. WAC 04169]|uniref:hypothetical protein n=1 Tax=Amycolatopsis sp. WAC 04169 TaxID=2203197 RepID=UPI000F76EC30|nr:hypothetical protein [Amycolatopsis sp. WAC 04169]RSN31387.1 hypothetical protein DMC61_14665 [Amycolatopsis sp. WAC 04169]